MSKESLANVAREAAKEFFAQIPKGARANVKIESNALEAASNAMIRADETVGTFNRADLCHSTTVFDFVRPIVAKEYAFRFPLDRLDKEAIIYRAKHPDYRSTKRNESILAQVQGAGTCLVFLARMDSAELEQRFVEALGWKDGKRVRTWITKQGVSDGKPEINPCGLCGCPVDGCPRNLGGEMQYSCPTGECMIKLERRTNREAAKRRAAFKQHDGWCDLSDGGVGRWHAKRWLVTFKKGSDKRWTLLFNGYRYKAGGIAKNREEAWTMALAIVRISMGISPAWFMREAEAKRGKR